MASDPATAATIEAVGVTATHDGETALVVSLRYPNGAVSQVQIDNAHLPGVMARAGVPSPAFLVGQSWQVLNIWDQPASTPTGDEGR